MKYGILLYNINNDNKYIRKETDKYVIDCLLEDKYIKNNLNINIDKIEILNGFGVLLYNNNNIVKEFINDKIKIEYIEDMKIILFTLFDKFCSFNKNPDLIIYFQDNEYLKFNTYIYENKKYNIGDIVYPNNIRIIEEDYDISFSENIIQSYLSFLDNENSNSIFEETITESGFKIIDKITDKFYKIEKITKTNEDYNNCFYTTDEYLSNLEEIKEKALYIYNNYQNSTSIEATN